MKLRELLQRLIVVQKDIGASKPYICGGTPRDKYMGRLDNISDLDITTGDKTVDYLSQEFEIVLRKEYNVARKAMPDGHSTIFVGNLKMDFSSNFNIPDIDNILHKMGIQNPSEMQKEMYSRDFTCNSLLLDINLKKIIDPTQRGFKDIKEKKIRTCLAPELTLTSNKNRVVRSIYLACKLGFDLDESIIEYVRKNPSSVKISTDKVMAEKLTDAFDRDPEKASALLSKMNLWTLVPITSKMYPYYEKNKGNHIMSQNKLGYFQNGQDKDNPNTPAPKKKKYKSEPALVNQPRFKEPLYRNYDLYDVPGVSDKPKHGPGAGWHDMHKFKSIKDFLASRRKKLKDKYKADDSWIQDDGSLSKKDPVIKARAALFVKLTKTAIDFSIDDQVTPILGDSGTYSGSAQIGGISDKYLSENDFEGKSVDKLNFGRDYAESNDCSQSDIKYNEGRDAYNCTRCGKMGFNGPYKPIPTVEELHSGKDYTLNDHKLDQLESKYPEPQEPPLMGMPNGIKPEEDLDADRTVNNINPQYGTTDSGNQTYDNLSY